MGERSRNALNRAKRTTTAPARGGSGTGTSWGDKLVLEPVLDDGRRSNPTKAPPGGPAAGDRYIVGYNASGAWASLVGELVEYSGSAWAAQTSLLTGAIVYSKKREEYLELTELLGASIAPALSPELWQTVSPAPGSVKFWAPWSLVDTLGNVIDQGVVRSRTVESASWTMEEYYRYIVKAGDATIPSLAGYIATLVSDVNTHASYWVFHKPAEGALVYVDDVNAYYWYNGTTWQLFTSGGTGGPVGTVYAAEGRQGVAGLGSTVLQASASDTWKKIAFTYSAIANTDICPLSFFTAGGNEFTAPRDGLYKIGYHGFRITFTTTDPFPDCQIYVSIRVNDTVKQISLFPQIDDYEGDSAHILQELSLGDVVTLQFKCTGTNYNAEFTVNNGFNFYVHTLDGGGGGDLVPHSLGQHTDTVFTTPTLGDVVQFDGTNWVNQPVVATASPHQIISSSHSDSQLSGSITNGQILKRVSNKWQNWTPVLADLSNVILTSPANGQLLGFNGTNWVNVSLSTAIRLDDLSDVNMTGKANNSVPRWSVGANKYLPWVPVLSGLADVSTAGAIAGQGLVYNGSGWGPGNPTASVTAVYFAGSVQMFPTLIWSAYSTSGGTFTQTQVGGPSGYYFFTPPVAGNYEMTVTGVATYSGSTQYGIYLNSIGSPLGLEITMPAALGNSVVSISACAYLSGGNKMGFGFRGTPTSAYLNITMKLIGQ